MPKLIPQRWVHIVAAHRLFRGDLQKLATVTGIPHGTLRNAIAGHDEMRLGRIYQVAQALGIPDGDVPTLIVDTGIPDTPPEQPPNTPKAPPKRKDEKKTGPKKPTDDLRAAS